MGRTVRKNVVASILLSGAMLLIAGCGKRGGSEAAGPPQPPSAAGGMQLCNFIGGPEDAPVKVEAYYPGRHEDTLAAVKSLLKTFPGKVRVEIVDWRTEEGMRRRDACGLTCAGVMINGKNAFELEVNGQKRKVLFVRGINGEWTKEDLEAAVRQELEKAEKGGAAGK